MQCNAIAIAVCCLAGTRGNLVERQLQRFSVSYDWLTASQAEAAVAARVESGAGVGLGVGLGLVLQQTAAATVQVKVQPLKRASCLHSSSTCLLLLLLLLLLYCTLNQSRSLFEIYNRKTAVGGRRSCFYCITQCTRGERTDICVIVFECRNEPFFMCHHSNRNAITLQQIDWNWQIKVA